VLVESTRADKFLWYVRLFKSRSLAQLAITDGHVRINSKRLERASFLVHVNDVITLQRGDNIIAIRILSIPARRGPAAEAQACYLIL
jgi:ribosome-associated heat shock protein Hsp15